MPFFFGGQTSSTIDFVYVWTAPTTGSAVVFYNVYHKIGDAPYTLIGTSTTTQYTVPCVVGEINLVRVSGVDAQAREGVMSEPSDPNNPYISYVPYDPVYTDPLPEVKSVGCWRAIL